jgi:acyl-CoA thioester hydrolase
LHQKRIEIRWRDMDAYRHVNNAVYLTYLEEVRDEWLEQALDDLSSPWDFVLARVAIDFRRELRQEDDEIVASCRLVRIGTSSIGTREEIRLRDGAVSAKAEAVLVARNLEKDGSRPLTTEERAAFERELDSSDDT